jgi:biopolymer transport protein ExbD
MTTTGDFDVDIRPRKTKTEEADLDITPMIDITFLLLAFFVVVSKLDSEVPVPLPVANYGTTVAEENCVVIVVTTQKDGEPAKIFKGKSLSNSSQVTSEGALDIEAEITEYVENEISNRPSIEAVLIKGAEFAREGEVETIRRGVAGSKLALERKLYYAVKEQ